MPLVIIAGRQEGRYVVDPCPSCGLRHRHRKAGAVRATCEAEYNILAVPPAPKQRRGR